VKSKFKKVQNYENILIAQRLFFGVLESEVRGHTYLSPDS